MEVGQRHYIDVLFLAEPPHRFPDARELGAVVIVDLKHFQNYVIILYLWDTTTTGRVQLLRAR